MSKFKIEVTAGAKGFGPKLGISKERFEVIKQGIVDAHGDGAAGVGVEQIISKASEMAETPGELAFICMTIGEYHEMLNNDPMVALLNALVR